MSKEIEDITVSTLGDVMPGVPCLVINFHGEEGVFESFVIEIHNRKCYVDKSRPENKNLAVLGAASLKKGVEWVAKNHESA